MDKSVVEGTAIDKVKHALRSSGIVSPKIEEGKEKCYTSRFCP